jgi:hypothetical protein
MSAAGTPAEPSMAVAARTRRERKAQAWRGRSCENCGAFLQGPFCHQCGQPEKTPIRNLLALSNDAFDYLFDVDARVWRTLVSLFFRPGRLTELYLRGKRMSFVRPLRIYLVMSALLFVVVTSMSELGGIKVGDTGDIVVIDGNPGADPDTPDRPRETAGDEGARSPAVTPAPAPAVDGAESAAPLTGAGNAVDEKDDEQAKDGKKEPLTITIFGDQPWHPTDNPIAFDWLPATGNQWLNDYIGIIMANMELARDDPKRLGHAFLRVLPQSLFVLLPIFALLLKVVLVFKRRMYMEHLMVAIHSHTFIYMGILVAVTLSWIAERWPTGWTNPWWMLMGFSIAWIPVNLFLTQKRVYRQRWWGAPIAFFVLGTLYLCLVGFTAVGALVASLVNL